MFDGWLNELRDVAVEGLSRGELCDAAAASGRLRAALDGFDARLAAALTGLGDDGAGPSAMFRGATKCSQREADRRARRAEGLAELPTTAAALAAGEITAEHADTLLRAAEATSSHAVEASKLVRHATERPADLLNREARDWTRRTQSQTSLEAQQRRRVAARRCVIFDNESDMTVLHAELDPITGAKVRSMLDTAVNAMFTADGGRDHADQIRTVQQRRADALAELIAGTGNHDGPNRRGDDAASTTRRGRSGPVRTQLLVIAHADGTAEIPGTGPIPAGELAGLACHSDLFGLVFSTDGRPLWHGTRVRIADDNQWRMLVARDKGCVICDTRPARCEAHHVIFARPPHNGPTDIDNLVLLCAHHHHLVHDRGQTLRRRADGTWHLHPRDPPDPRDPPGSGPPRRSEDRGTRAGKPEDLDVGARLRTNEAGRSAVRSGGGC